MSEDVLIKRADGVLEIRMNRPAKKNALSQAMYGAMADALEDAAKDEAIRAVMLAAEGDMFTSGNDIADFAAVAQGGGDDAVHTSNVMRFLQTLASYEKPVIAAVRGSGVGIGMTMLLHCDIVVIADDAQLILPFTALGLTPEAGSSHLLPAQVGYKQAYMMLALGQPVSGGEAVAYGIATDSAPRDEVEARARALAQECCKRPPEAMRITKMLLRNSKQILTRLGEEQKLFAERLKSPEAMAAFEAFFKR
ncbi:MAG: enoyl-CoA hydratase-related protein [Rhodomicrobiaceae bacterium]